MGYMPSMPTIKEFKKTDKLSV